MSEREARVKTPGKDARARHAADAGRPRRARSAALRLGQDFIKDDLYALVENAADWIWETDRDHRFTWVSDQFESTTGLSAEVVLGRSRLDLLQVVARISKNATAHLDDLTAHRPFREFIYQISGTRPECRWVSVSGFPRYDDAGSFCGYRGVGRNVTNALASYDELDDARRLIQEHEKREREFEDTVRAEESHAVRMMSALNVLEDAFGYYDTEDRLTLHNDAMLTIFAGLEDMLRPGVRFADFLDAGLARGIFLPGDADRSVWRAMVLDRRKGEGQSELTFQLGDGRWITRRDLRTADGGIIGVCTDVTALKLNEARIEKARADAEAAQARLQSAIDAISDGFVLWDAEDRLVACNEAFRHRFTALPNLGIGRTFDEMSQEYARSGQVEEAIGREAQWVAERTAMRQKRLGRETITEVKDGRWILRRDQLTPNGDRVGIRSDVTEMKRREDALAEASAKAGALLIDLQRTVDAMHMGVVVLDENLDAEIINKAFYDIWKVTAADVSVGSPFRALMDVNRHNGIYDVADSEWEGYVASRLAEIRAGTVPPREFRRADGRTMIYSVTELSGGKRLVSYYDISEMKDREKELAAALERARLADAVLNGVKDPIFVKDSDLNFVFVNEAFSSLFDMRPEAIVGKSGRHFLPASEVAQFEISERQVLHSGEPYEIAEDFELHGTQKSRIVRKNRVRVDGGKDYVAGFLFDITETKRREVEADEARRQLESVLESLPAGVIIYDRNDRYVLGNRLVKETLPALGGAMSPGKSLRSALEAAHAAGYFRDCGDAELDRLYDTDPEAWIDGYTKRYHVPHAVYERRSPDGKWQQAFDTRTPDGTFIGVRVDITELKERETALQESMRQIDLFRHVLDDLPVAAYVKDQDLSIRFVNKAWCSMTGIDKEQATGRNDLELFGKEGEGFAERDNEVIATGKVNETEETLTHRDGRVSQLIARKSRLMLRDGTVHLIGSSSDITELKQRERELEDAQRKAVLADRAKSEFLANMSHEIRTPMNGVLGMAELLAKSDLDAKQKTFTDIIVKSGNALLTIINDILDFSKIDAGQMVLDPAPFNLGEAIEDVATLVSTRAKEKDLELIVRIQPGLPEMFIGDVGRIRQIITNLLGNAVKFTDSGHVLVNVTGEECGTDTKLRIAITDTGIGIPADKLRQVFEKFSQVDASSTRRHEGTGLGLAITSRLIDLMQGNIEVASEEGHGSTFTVTLSLPHNGDRRRRRHAPLDVTGARVLIVDDNAVNRTILSEQMNSWSFDACAAESGMEGLKVLDVALQHGLKVDCVILDYQMPVMTGADVARVIREHPALADTPIIMLTSVDQSLSNKNYRDLDIDAHLIKPARSSALLDALVTSIQRHRARKESPEEQADAQDRHLPESAAELQPKRSATVRKLAELPGMAGHRVDILVAEDNEVNQLVFTQILGETPYTFEIVGNGRRALEAFGAMNPRMILMDVSMPEMNGLEATAAIREREAEGGGHVPIVGVTAHALKGDRERCLESGMDDYLSKPISPNALLTKIERWMGDMERGLLDAG